jgi:hypothetical protein
MLVAVEEEPMREELAPIDAEEMAGSVPNVQPHDAVEGVNSFTLKMRSYTKPRSQRSQSLARPSVRQLRPKGAHVAGRQVKTSFIIIGDEDTVSDAEGMEAAANLEEVQQVHHQHEGIIEVSSTGVLGGLGTPDKNLKPWSSR